MGASKKTENTHVQTVSNTSSQHSDEKIHSISSNSIPSKDIKIVFSDMSSGRQVTSNPTCSLPCGILYSSSNDKSRITSTDERPLKAKEYYGFEQNKDTKCNSTSITFEKIKKSMVSFAREDRETFGDQLAPIKKNKKLYSFSHSPLRNFSSQSCHPTQQITNANAQRLQDKSTGLNSPCYSLSTTTALLSTSLMSSDKVSVKIEEEIPACFNTNSKTKASSVKSGLTKVVEMSRDVVKLSNDHVSSNRTQPQSTSVESAFRTPSNGVMSLDNLPLRNHLTETRMTTKPETSIKTTKTAAVRPCCTDPVRKIAILSDAHLQEQAPLISSSETFMTVNLLEEKAHWSSILNSSVSWQYVRIEFLLLLYISHLDGNSEWVQKANTSKW